MSAADRFAAADQAAAEEEQALDAESLYDHERVAINKVLQDLNESVHKHRELSGFQREVRERFAEIGFVVRCDFYEEEHREHLEGAQIPQITLLGRCEPMKVGEFDHDRMGHEVRSNLLGQKGRDNVQRTQVAPGWAQSGSGLIVPN